MADSRPWHLRVLLPGTKRRRPYVADQHNFFLIKTFLKQNLLELFQKKLMELFQNKIDNEEK